MRKMCMVGILIMHQTKEYVIYWYLIIMVGISTMNFYKIDLIENYYQKYDIIINKFEKKILFVLILPNLIFENINFPLTRNISEQKFIFWES